MMDNNPIVVVYLDNTISFRYRDISNTLFRSLKKEFTYKNPDFIKKRRMGFYVGDTDRFVISYEIKDDMMVFPRGCAYNVRKSVANPRVERDGIISLLTRSGYTIKYVDNRVLNPVEFKWEFPHELHDYQKKSVSQFLRNKGNGIIVASTGSGKSVTMFRCIYELKQKTLIVAHTIELVKQLRREAASALGLRECDVGQLGGGQKTIGKELTVGIPRTIKGLLGQLQGEFGCIMNDEMHKCSATEYNYVVNQFSAKHKGAVTATIVRKDQKEFMGFDTYGKVVHEVPEELLVQRGKILDVSIKMIKTDINFVDYDDPDSPHYKNYHSFLEHIMEDTDRNDLILKYVLRSFNNGETSIVVSDRIPHLEHLHALLEAYGVKTGLVIHKNKKTNTATLDALRKKKIKVVCATSPIVTEGLDIKTLSTLFITVPTSSNYSRTKQLIGRARRLSDGKDIANIFYFWDHNQNFCAKAYSILKKEYKNTITI